MDKSNPKPSVRRLRAYAFDPSLSLKLDTAVINNITYKVRWEPLTPGPVGDYVEVVDYDPSSNCFYRPVNLGETFILAQDGLDPSESNPQFHQQMVYAVAMTTIRNFELALGRKITWSSHSLQSAKGAPRKKKAKDEDNESDFVQRLRIYPHALREANAYYSPQKKALLFGYFSATPDTPDLHLPGGTVYTCLSHDIIAHEITHALLDGMHRRYVEATHEDSLAFHEAFADIVALFQHFTFPEVLKSQISKTRGDLSSQSLLGQLAQEFGKAIGHYGSLRDALGKINKETGKWEAHIPDTSEYRKKMEPHARGSILVATIFEAFVNIYNQRVADLRRIASNGSGVLAQGSLHPDLVNRMASEASKTARHILSMCIRALDYCPPMDINYGDYLRALITADYDLVVEDTLDYRIALIEAFQKRGVYPENIKNMSVESLLCKAEHDNEIFENKFSALIEFFKKFKEKASYISNRKELHDLTKLFIAGGQLSALEKYKHLAKTNKDERIMGLHQRLNAKFMGESDSREFSKLTRLILDSTDCVQLGIELSTGHFTNGMPKLEIHNLKLVSRVGPQGNVINQILVTLTQRRGVVCEEDDFGNVTIAGFFQPSNSPQVWHRRVQKRNKFEYIRTNRPRQTDGLQGPGSEKVLPKGWFVFRGGCTLIFDLNYQINESDIKLKYVIYKDINSERRMMKQFRMLYSNKDFSLNATYFGSGYGNLEAEPFAIIHKVL